MRSARYAADQGHAVKNKEDIFEWHRRLKDENNVRSYSARATFWIQEEIARFRGGPVPGDNPVLDGQVGEEDEGSDSEEERERGEENNRDGENNSSDEEEDYFSHSDDEVVEHMGGNEPPIGQDGGNPDDDDDNPPILSPDGVKQVFKEMLNNLWFVTMVQTRRLSLHKPNSYALDILREGVRDAREGVRAGRERGHVGRNRVEGNDDQDNLNYNDPNYRENLRREIRENATTKIAEILSIPRNVDEDVHLYLSTSIGMESSLLHLKNVANQNSRLETYGQRSSFFAGDNGLCTPALRPHLDFAGFKEETEKLMKMCADARTDNVNHNNRVALRRKRAFKDMHTLFACWGSRAEDR